MIAPSFEDLLQKNKDDIVAKIIALVPHDKRREGMAMLKNLIDTMEALSRISKKYAGADSPIEAARQFLEEQDAPATQDEIVEELLSHDYRGGDRKRQAPRITASLNVHLNGTGQRGKNRLKKNWGSHRARRVAR